MEIAVHNLTPEVKGIVCKQKNLIFKKVLNFNLCYFSEWIRNRLISAGLEQFLSHTKKSFIDSY